MPKFSLRGPRDWRLRGRKNLARLTAPEQPTNLIGVGSRYLDSPVPRLEISEIEVGCARRARAQRSTISMVLILTLS